MITLPEAVSVLLTALEGEKLTAYQDTGGKWTDGIGNTKNVTPGQHITHEQAVADLIRNMAPIMDKVKQFPMLKAVALASFGFNCGVNALDKVIAGTDTIDNPIHCTDKHGNVLTGLTSRRRLEKMLIQMSDSLPT